MSGAAVVVQGPSAVPLARRIAAHVAGARLHAPRTRDIEADAHFAEGAASQAVARRVSVA